MLQLGNDNIYICDNAKEMTNLTFLDIFYRMSILAQSLYEWEGLPEGLSGRNLERFLFYEGAAMFYEDKEKGLMFSRVAHSGNLNDFDEPTKVKPLLKNKSFLTKSYRPHIDCVLVYNNPAAIPTSRTARIYASRMTQMQRTADININALKTPFVFRGSEKQKNTILNIYKNIDEYKPMFIIDKALEQIPLSVLDLKVPVLFPQLFCEKNKLLNEFLTFIGVNNANTDKRERLVDDEVRANNQQIEQSGEAFFSCRKEAVEEIKRIFGKEIKVKKRTNIFSSEGLQEPEPEQRKEGDEE